MHSINITFNMKLAEVDIMKMKKNNFCTKQYTFHLYIK